MATTIKLRRGTKSEWDSADPVLALAEPGLITDTGEIRTGDGTTAFNSLPDTHRFLSQDILSGTYVNAGTQQPFLDPNQFHLTSGGSRDLLDFRAPSVSAASGVATRMDGATDLYPRSNSVKWRLWYGRNGSASTGDILLEIRVGTIVAGASLRNCYVDTQKTVSPPANADEPTFVDFDGTDEFAVNAVERHWMMVRRRGDLSGDDYTEAIEILGVELVPA